MSVDFIKLFGPILLLIVWVIFSFHNNKRSIILSGIYFTSYIGLSSNFNFVYRETHQAIQILLIISWLIPSVKKGVLLKVNQITISFFAFILVSLATPPFDTDAQSQLINFIISICTMNFLFNSIRTTKDFKTIMQLIANLTIALTFLGLVEFILNPTTRIEGTFSNPNYFGLFLGIGSCIIFSTWRGFKRLIAITAIICVIVMSGSRAAIIFPILQLCWLAYQRGNLIKIIPTASVFMLSVFLVMSSGVTRYSDQSKMETSNAERIIFAKIAKRMANDNPFTGVGWGRFISEFRNYSNLSEQIITSSGYKVNVSHHERRVTHNDFLRILAELGWGAFLLSIYFTIYGIKIFLNNNSFNLNYLFPIYIGLLIFSITHNNMNNGFFWFFFLMPFFLKQHASFRCREKNDHRDKRTVYRNVLEKA